MNYKTPYFIQAISKPLLNTLSHSFSLTYTPTFFRTHLLSEIRTHSFPQFSILSLVQTKSIQTDRTPVNEPHETTRPGWVHISSQTHHKHQTDICTPPDDHAFTRSRGWRNKRMKAATHEIVNTFDIDPVLPLHTSIVRGRAVTDGCWRRVLGSRSCLG